MKRQTEVGILAVYQVLPVGEFLRKGIYTAVDARSILLQLVDLLLVEIVEDL